MEITKFGHCCMLIREGAVSILIDPGMLTTQQDHETNIDLVLLTHEHPDHLDIQSLKRILGNNPGAKIITNRSVGPLLQKENIVFDLLEHGQKTMIKNISIEGFGERHALMHSSLEPIQNTGYLIADRFFYPGDAFTIPHKTRRNSGTPRRRPLDAPLGSNRLRARAQTKGLFSGPRRHLEIPRLNAPLSATGVGTERDHV
jgi:L-ascorbate metabolism protein UlaG (beta-lactamase superfamily)